MAIEITKGSLITGGLLSPFLITFGLGNALVTPPPTPPSGGDTTTFSGDFIGGFDQTIVHTISGMEIY